MTRRSSGKGNHFHALVSEGLYFWCALLVLVYSLLVPLLAIESVSLAVAFTQLSLLIQGTILLLVLIGTVDIFGQLASGGWHRRLAIRALAILCLLGGIQPDMNSSSNLIAWIGGAIPSSQVRIVEIGLHCATAVGAALLTAQSLLPQRRTSRITSIGLRSKHNRR